MDLNQLSNLNLKNKNGRGKKKNSMNDSEFSVKFKSERSQGRESGSRPIGQ